jgi:hypothetical protein
MICPVFTLSTFTPKTIHNGRAPSDQTHQDCQRPCSLQANSSSSRQQAGSNERRFLSYSASGSINYPFSHYSIRTHSYRPHQRKQRQLLDSKENSQVPIFCSFQSTTIHNKSQRLLQQVVVSQKCCLDRYRYIVDLTVCVIWILSSHTLSCLSSISFHTVVLLSSKDNGDSINKTATVSTKQQQQSLSVWCGCGFANLSI